MGRPAAKERGVGPQDGLISLQTGGLRPVFMTGLFFSRGPCLLGENRKDFRI